MFRTVLLPRSPKFVTTEEDLTYKPKRQHKHQVPQTKPYHNLSGYGFFSFYRGEAFEVFSRTN